MRQADIFVARHRHVGTQRTTFGMCECLQGLFRPSYWCARAGGARSFVLLGAWRLIGAWQIAHSPLPSKPRIERSLHLVRASATYR